MRNRNRMVKRRESALVLESGILNDVNFLNSALVTHESPSPSLGYSSWPYAREDRTRRPSQGETAKIFSFSTNLQVRAISPRPHIQHRPSPHSHSHEKKHD